MVFVWSQLTEGDPNYTLVQVSVNDIIIVFAFCALAAFLLGVSDIQVPWETLLFPWCSTLCYRYWLVLIRGTGWKGRVAVQWASLFTNSEAVVGYGNLLATVVLLFGFQAETIIASPRRFC